MLHDVLTAVGLLLVLEGILPFLSPSNLRRTLAQIAQMSDQGLRFVGLTCMVIGCLILYLSNLL